MNESVWKAATLCLLMSFGSVCIGAGLAIAGSPKAPIAAIATMAFAVLWGALAVVGEIKGE